MTDLSLSLADLYLAYRQAKSALFFEKRGVGMNELAAYEQDLPNNLKRLRSNLSNGKWFDRLDVGEVWIVPKRFHSQEQNGDRVVRIGVSSESESIRPVDVQVRVSPHPDFAIAEVIYLWQFGGLLESVLTDEVVGYRLDIRNEGLSKYRRWIFQYWPSKYREFRSAPLSAAKKILSEGNDATILSGDLANFYDTVNPDFLVSKDFLGELMDKGVRPSELRRYRRASVSLLGAYARFRAIASTRLSMPISTGIPIGALTSRVVANVALASLDKYIGGRSGVVCYRRYVDDLVVVGRSLPGRNAEDMLRHYLPLLPGFDGLLALNVDKLKRSGSEFQVQERKIRIHHLGGEPGSDFLEAVESDFTKALSERRAFIDASTLVGDGVAHLIRASNAEGSPLRVLREADRARLERFSLSTSLRSLERATSMINHQEAKELVRNCLERVGRVLDAEDNWVDDLDVALRLLKLAIVTGDWQSAREFIRRMDSEWGTVEKLRAKVGELYYRGKKIDQNRLAPWRWLRNYLHERRIEAVCACLPIGMDAVEIASKFRGGVLRRRVTLKATVLRRRAERLALADLRARDREEDGMRGSVSSGEAGWMLRSLRSDPVLKVHLKAVDAFIGRCHELGDKPWIMPAARLYLSTRPPSYFDIARRWLNRVEMSGFTESIFSELLDVVNGVRGTRYSNPVGRMIDRSTIYMEGVGGREAANERSSAGDPRIFLANLVVRDEAWIAAATRVSGSSTGRPLLTKQRLQGVAEILDKAEHAASKDCRGLLVLPELSLPRKWLRIVANHVVKSGRFGLVAGLEYLHYSSLPHVANQAVAVLPGPFMSVATWPWTKRLPAREEELQLSKLKVPMSFAPPSKNPLPRAVIHTDWGSFSVLICSELIEVKRVADLLGRAQVVLCPAWNPDTSSYDHLVQSAGFQLHAIVAIANNGHYSDCRAWAPRNERWERDLCRLIERDVNDIVYVDIPIQSLSKFHAGDKQGKNIFSGVRAVLKQKKYANAKKELDKLEESLPGLWRPLPPDWPD